MSTNLKITKVNVYSFDSKLIYAHNKESLIEYLDEVSNIYGADFESMIEHLHTGKYIVAKISQLNKNTTISSQMDSHKNNTTVVEDTHLMFNGFFDSQADAEQKLESMLVK